MNDAITYVSHSNIEGGPDNVYCEPGSIINWLEGNIDADPLFYGAGGDFAYYSLSADSPCIDAGTLDLPDGVILPEFDLAGNPRVSGDTIDMGCYEFQFPQNAEDYELPVNHNYQLTNHPNPFTGETMISFSLTTNSPEKARIEIYNIRGQKVDEITISKEQTSVNWQRSNHANGVYFYKLIVDGKAVDTKKMILLK